jgi:hypothetical protein
LVYCDQPCQYGMNSSVCLLPSGRMDVTGDTASCCIHTSSS